MPATTRPLIGRDPEIAALDRRLQESAAGAPGFVVVRGEPGIGKTSLLGELRGRAREQGFLVLDGRATELERELPFGLVVDALDAFLDGLDARTFDRLAADELGELAAVFPSLRALAPQAAALGTASERFRAHHAVRELLERLAVGRPVLVTLDDAHWSDGASVELIGHLLRRPPEAAVLVVTAYRTGRAPPALAAAVDRAIRDGGVDEVVLGPLSERDAERLLDGADERDEAALYRECGGNPFYLLQLARRAGGSPAAADGARDGDGVPPAVSAAIAAELSVLDEETQRFVRAAAVAGDPFDVDLAAAVASCEPQAALDALDELVARDLVRPDEVPRRFRFRHPLVRSGVYAGTSPGVRLLAHERAAAVLAARGAPATARAHHVEQSARHGDSEAVDVLRDAGAAVAGRAPASAVRWYAAALRILPPAAGPAARAELLMPLAVALAGLGRLQESREALLETLALRVGDASVPRVAVVSACANVEQLLGLRREAHERLVTELEAQDDPTSPDAAALMVSLALDGFLTTDLDAMAGWARRAAGAAAPLGDAPLTAAATAMLAFAEANAGPVGDARRQCAAAAELVDAMDDEALARRIDAIAHLAGAEYLLERFDTCLAHGERALAVARASGQGDFFPTLTSAMAGALFSTGRLSEAEVHLAAAVESARLTDNALALALSLLNLSYTALIQGHVRHALQLSEEAAATTARLPPGSASAWTGGIHAMVLLEAGESRRALEMLQASAGARVELVPGALRANFLEIGVRALIELDRVDEAHALAEEALGHAARFGLRLPLGAARRATAHVALARREPAAAAESALAAVEDHDAIGARVEAAVSRTLAGHALLVAGQATRATAELERAAEGLDACGATRYRDRAERELRRLGRGVYRRTRRGDPDAKGVASLTGRELAVARLVVDRRTNAEIAQELFLSIKTVETHLRNIFRKLDAGSRVEVARIVAAADGAGES